ncbi:glutamine--fructose-6-phosphate transaminase (isomerizing) [Halomarina oriensis]|uniref:Glutamine--fructose-6-phosphate aminotransferase [isomerizing] n=1 Tax=Halomarina oriensis TaxID=671145 RepID=A0A6B0GFA4_9EURY|nr:glutamine--fructose-6-phosphate transaminase (isomerizing) [Halomarina oriensis]MWG33190.1 glutamine--fructose-6-phosphate transaminase (isomerizing) [Halomarina oriensis]
MCGITACVGGDDAVGGLLTGLGNLEYRGYDSAGIAVPDDRGLNVVKREGRLDRLREALGTDRPTGTIGIGHTRWSTHGPPTDANAHPHQDCTGHVAVVHNGIIDNYETLRRDLEGRGHRFESETDTEVVPHLIEEELTAGKSTEAAFRAAVQQLSGSYAIACLVDGEDEVYAARQGSPLVLGEADGRYFLASDVPAFREFTDRVVYLEDGDIVVVGEEGYDITDLSGVPLARDVDTVDWEPEAAGKSGYPHFMLKEIHEQPESLRQTIHGRIETLAGKVSLEEFDAGAFEDVERVQFVSMGTSHHASMYAAAQLTARGMTANAYMAGEYADCPAPIDEHTLVVAVTQSGETADTMNAVRRARDAGARTLAVTNVVGSSVTRECDESLFIRAGPEIGVAATKTFSSQVVALTLLGERIAEDSTGVQRAAVRSLLEGLADLPGDVQQVLDESNAEGIADALYGCDSYFFLGRGPAHSVALEGALKFKEISYEHAEGFAASELKHGPLALVTENTPVFGVITGEDDLKVISNLKEVQARGAPVIVVAPASFESEVEFADYHLPIPESHPEVAGILANVQLQLVSYHAADQLGRPIDKPRNLAKSVTVE